MRSMRNVVPVLILLLATAAAAQTPDALTEKANQHFQAKEWKPAAELYQKILKTDGDNFRFWLRLGTARQRLEEFEPAVEAYKKVVASQAPAPFRALALFQGAESLAGMGARDEALDWLGRSAELGFTGVQSIESSETLAALKGESFDGALEKVRRNQSPCLYDETHKQFDFWVGDWDVFVPTGQQAGTNRIEKIINGCVIYENWVSASGVVGKSFNFYDRTDASWHQLWVDGQGNVLRMKGSFADGVLEFEGTSTDAEGNTIQDRLRFFDLGDGRVRQFWEQSPDRGKSWNVAFDGEYRPKKKD